MGGWGSFGSVRDRVARFCAAHRAPGHIDIKNLATCVFPGCSGRGRFGLRPSAACDYDNASSSNTSAPTTHTAGFCVADTATVAPCTASAALSNSSRSSTAHSLVPVARPSIPGEPAPASAVLAPPSAASVSSVIHFACAPVANASALKSFGSSCNIATTLSAPIAVTDGAAARSSDPCCPALGPQTSSNSSLLHRGGGGRAYVTGLMKCGFRVGCAAVWKRDGKHDVVKRGGLKEAVLAASRGGGLFCRRHRLRSHVLLR